MHAAEAPFDAGTGAPLAAASTPQRRLWLILLVAFTALLALIAVAGVAALLAVSSMNAADVARLNRFRKESRLLGNVRTQIYLSGTLVRDALLAPAATDARAQAEAINAAERSSANALKQYERDIEPEERAPFVQLRTQIQDYWRVIRETLSRPSQRRADKYAFFYNELVPRRTAMLQIADRIASIDEATLTRGEQQFADEFDRFRWASLSTLGIALLGGILVTAVTTSYVLRLERESGSRLKAATTAQSALQELSARLVRAQEEERRALSRELHDEVSQPFSAILMEIERLLDVDQPVESRTGLETVRQLAMHGVDVSRNMSLLLRPSMLDDFGLVPALRWLARDTARRTGLRLQVDAPETADDLPDEHKTCIFRVVQEALANVARHAQARTVQLTIRRETERVSVMVQDDGVGFDTRRVRGLGLLGMEERVRHIGGELRLEAHAGRGTLLFAELPVASILAGDNHDGKHPDSAGG